MLNTLINIPGFEEEYLCTHNMSLVFYGGMTGVILMVALEAGSKKQSKTLLDDYFLVKNTFMKKIRRSIKNEHVYGIHSYCPDYDRGFNYSQTRLLYDHGKPHPYGRFLTTNSM